MGIYDEDPDVLEYSIEGWNSLEYREPWDHEPPIPAVEDWEVERHLREQRLRYALTPSQFTEETVLMPNAKTRALEAFSFADRPYLRKVYNTQSNRVLLMAGRQVEKCVHEDEVVVDSFGKPTPIKDLLVGDILVCLATEETSPNVERGSGSRMTTSKITWKSRKRKKPCREIRTRQGHRSRMATTHPVRVWNGWKAAGDLEIGDRIAVVRRAGVFSSCDYDVSSSRVRLTAYMIGDGGCNPKDVTFTNETFEVLDDFDDALVDEGMSYTFSPKKDSNTTCFRLPRYRAEKLRGWLEEDGLLGTDSYSKFLPDWVFRLSREQTSLFLNRLWSTDGHVKCNTDTKWSIEYCSMSERLVRQVQALLWKLGIPSRIRENWPSIYKKRGEKVLAYILRIETQEGVRSFVRDIGALGKIERQELDPWETNNNRDTLPLEVNEFIREIYDEVSPKKGDRTLQSAGLRRSPKYCLTRKKLLAYVEFFEGDPRYSPSKVRLLKEHVSSDIYWDEVESINEMGEQWCYDLTVDRHHNFVAGGIVTHNSTSLGNRMLALCCLIPHFRALYVSPSSTQTKEFSNRRLREVLMTSPRLRTWFPQHLTDNVFEKRAINRSGITLRYAFLNADRCRGLSADSVILDEFQDLLLDTIPVIEEAASHSAFKYFIYAGTPKSLDNPIEHYWSTFSTRNEWAVPCERHGTPKVPGSWHWNILGERNISKAGPVCDRCGGPIFPNHPKAQWVRTGNPDPNLTVFEGFRIPQLMVPWISWKELWTKYTDYPRAQFFNECLGQSFDSGQRPLTQDDIRQNCDSSITLTPEGVADIRRRMAGVQLYGGIDWGQGSTNSYTVFFVGGYLNNKFTIFFCHRFVGAESEPRTQLKKICRIIETFNLARVCVDHGGGFWPNGELLRRYGSNRIVRVQYLTPNVFMRWDEALGRYIIHRSEVMSAMFNAIKRGSVVRFPAWKYFKSPFAADMLSIFSEYSEKMHMTQYKKSANNTDDSFHAFLYCFLSSMIDIPRPDVFIPSQAVDRMLEAREEY